MKLRIVMLIATVMAAGTGLAFAERYIVAGPNVRLTDAEFWTELMGGKDDSEVGAPNQELIVVGRMSMKDTVARKLVNGELTLQQAAARFVEVNRDNKHYFVGLDCAFPDLGRNETVYRDVVTWTKRLYEEDADYSVICEYLEKEFEKCRKQDFPIPLLPLRPRATAE